MDVKGGCSPQNIFLSAEHLTELARGCNRFSNIFKQFFPLRTYPAFMKLGLRYQITYRYDEPVGFSPHEVRLFPRSDRAS